MVLLCVGRNLVTFEIVYEDEEIFLINKPAGVSVQGGAGIAHPLDDEFSKQVGYKVHLVHRLDRETSGLLVVAKHSAAAKKWISLISGHQVKKEYTAICFGTPVVNGKFAKAGTISAAVTKQGREQSAVTHFTVEETKKILVPQELFAMQTDSDADTKTDFPANAPVREITLTKLHLVLGTGRMHQIRIHLASAQCPIVADDKHGNFKLNKLAKKLLKIKTLCLAATKITIPAGGKARTFEIAPPAHILRFSLPQET